MRVCDIYDEVTDKKKILRVVIPFYVQTLIDNGRIDDALTVLYRAGEKGLLSDEYMKLYKKLKAVRDVYNIYDEMTGVEKRVIEKLNSGEYPSDSLLEELRRYTNMLNEARKELRRAGIDDSRILDAVLDANSLYTILKTFKGFLPLVEKVNSIVKDMEKPNLTSRDYDGIRNRLIDVYNAMSKIYRELSSLSLARGTFNSLKNRLAGMIRDKMKAVWDTSQLAGYISIVLSDFEKLMNDLSRFNEDNNLLNPTYVNELRSDLVSLLNDIKLADKMASEYKTVSDYFEMVKRSIIKSLNELKERLVSADGRFDDRIFKYAEEKTGVTLKHVEHGGISERLEDIVKDSRDAAVNLLHSDETWKKIWGAIAMVGAGALDTITLIGRPSEFKDMVENTIKGIGKAIEYTVEGETDKLEEGARNIFYSMFGTKENALYTIGTLLAFYVGGKVLDRVPIPAKYKAYIESVMYGDPFKLTIDIMRDTRIASRLAETLELTAGNPSLWRELVRGFKDRLAEKITREIVEKSRARYIRENARAIRGKIANIIAKSSSYTRAIEDVRRAIENMGIEKALESIDRFNRLFEEFTRDVGEDYIASRLRAAGVKGSIGSLSFNKTIMDYLKTRKAVGLVEELAEKTKRIINGYDETVKLLDDLREYIGEDEWARLKERLKTVESSMLKADISRATSILEQVKQELESYKPLKAKIDNIASILREAGYDSLAGKVLKNGLDGVVEAVEELSRDISGKTMKIIDRIRNTLIGMSGNEKIRSLASMITGKIEELIYKRIPESHIHGLEDYARRIAEEFTSAESIPGEVRDASLDLLSKARSGSVSLADIERFTDILAKYSSRLAGIIDLNAVSRLIREAVSYVEDVLKDTEAYRFIENDVNSINEVVSRLSRGVAETRTYSYRELNRMLEESINRLADYVMEYDKGLAEKLRDSLESLEDALSKGDAKSVSKSALSLYEALSRISLLKGLPRDITGRLRELADTLLGKAGLGNKSIESSLRRLAHIIDDDLKSIEELPEGWGYVIIDVKNARYTPVVARLSDMNRVMEILRTPRKDFIVDIGGREIHVSRDIHLSPDGTMSVSYRLEFPEGRWLEYKYVIRKTGKGMADIYVYTRYDPRLVELLESDKRLSDSLGRLIEEGDLIREIDPDYDVLSRIAVETGRGLRFMGDVFKSIRNTIPILLVASGSSGVWKYILDADKIDLIKELKPYITQVDTSLKEKLTSIGVNPIGEYGNLAGYTAIIGSIDKLFEPSKIIVLKYKGKLIPLPVVVVNGEDIVVIPNIDLDTGVRIDEETIGKLKEEGEDVYEVEFTPPSKGSSATGGVARRPIAQIPSIPVAVGGGRTGRGLQYEILTI